MATGNNDLNQVLNEDSLSLLISPIFLGEYLLFLPTR